MRSAVLLVALAASLGSASAAGAAEGDFRVLSAMADRASEAWLERQTVDGTFVDPLTEDAVPDYGSALIGYGLLRAGRRRGDDRLVSAGTRAMESMLGVAPTDRGVFSVWAMGEAYDFASRRLGGHPSMRAARPAFESYLRAAGEPYLSSNLVACRRQPECFHNHELVETLSDLRLLRTGLRTTRLGAKLADRPRLARVVRRGLGNAAAAVGTRSRTSWPGPKRGLGLLSDSGNFALAYHPLATALLARAVSILGDRSPERLRRALRRAADSLAALTAPDGDVSYLGRSQQDSWSVAAALYVGVAMAARSGSGSRRARYAALAERALARLRRVYGADRGDISVLPRRRSLSAGSAGLESYASTVNFAGLTIYVLNLAADEARHSPPLEPGPLPADTQGWFLDPAQADLALVREGPLWFAVHGRTYELFPRFYGSHRLLVRDPGPDPLDLRYDFGLLALKWRDGQGAWHDLLRPRPLQGARSATESAGPVMVRPGRRFLPFGRRIEVQPGGVVVVNGGFRAPGGRPLPRRVRFRFSPLGDGVRLDFPARRGDSLRLKTYLPSATARTREGRAFDAVSVASASPAPLDVNRETGYASCCDAEMVATTMVLKPRRDRRVAYTLRLRRVRRPATASVNGGGFDGAAAAVVAMVAMLCSLVVVGVRRRAAGR